jgi:hypothetical protein
MQFCFVTVLPRYLKFVTLSNGLLATFILLLSLRFLLDYFLTSICTSLGVLKQAIRKQNTCNWHENYMRGNVLMEVCRTETSLQCGAVEKYSNIYSSQNCSQNHHAKSTSFWKLLANTAVSPQMAAVASVFFSVDPLDRRFDRNWKINQGLKLAHNNEAAYVGMNFVHSQTDTQPPPVLWQHRIV